MSAITIRAAATRPSASRFRLLVLAPLLVFTGCCSSQKDLPPDEVCRDVAFSLANRTEACTGDRDLASQRWDQFESQYTCLVTTVDDRMRQHYVCPAEIMRMSCDQLLAYGDDLDALFRSIPECLFVVGRADGTPIYQPDAALSDGGDVADVAEDASTEDVLDASDASLDVSVDVSDAGSDAGEPDARPPDSSADAADASIPPDVAADVIVIDASPDVEADSGDSATVDAAPEAGVGPLPRIESYTQGTAPLSNQVHVNIFGRNFDATSQVTLAGNPLTIAGSSPPSVLVGQGTASTPPYGSTMLQVINGDLATGIRSNIVYFNVASASGSPELVDYGRLWAQPGDALQLLGRNLPSPTFVVADGSGVEATATVQGTLSWRGQTLTAAQVVVPGSWQTGQLEVRAGGAYVGPMLWVEPSLMSLPGTTISATASYPGFAAGAAKDNDLTTAWIEAQVCGPSCTNGASLSISLGSSSPLKQLVVAAARNLAVWNSVAQVRVVLEDGGGTTLLDEAFVLPAERHDLYLDFASPIENVRTIRLQILGDNNVRSGFSEVAAYAN